MNSQEKDTVYSFSQTFRNTDSASSSHLQGVFISKDQFLWVQLR